MSANSRGNPTVGRTIELVSSLDKVVTRKSMRDDTDDLAYWRSRTVEERLEYLVQLRREFEGWTDETEPGLPRVARVLRGP